MQIVDYAWLVPGLPLFGTVIIGLFGRFLPRRLSGAIASALVGGSFVLSLAIFSMMLRLPPDDRSFNGTLYTWVSSGTFRADVGILLDPLSIFMMLIVTGVGFFIHIYSIGYMHEDEGYSRYFTYLNLFVFSMLTLVMANNFLLLFAGWELVGICSYLLIGFWFGKQSAVAAGKKAFITTRVGDVGFTLGIILTFAVFGSIVYQDVFAAAGTVANGWLVAITLLLLLGAIGKSAQIPLYVWLPDAMEGPTPVSALIHAATMVTAGVYLIARTSPLYVEVPGVMLTVAILGVATAFFAATIALVNNDIKRVLAYSTISQIGFMFLGVGVGAFAAGVFHLMTHAFFKALLFLGAGSVMHSLGGNVDLQKMGGLGRKMPITYWTFLIASLAIAGIAPLSGFFSKDEILAGAFHAPVGGVWLYAVGLLTSLLTAFYIFRLFFKAFHGEPRMDDHEWEHAHESPPAMTIPLIVLAVGAALAGFLGVPRFLAPSAGWADMVGAFLHPSLAEGSAHAAGITDYVLVLLALVVGIVGISLAYYLYVMRPGKSASIARRIPNVYNTLKNKYWVDEVYQAAFVIPGKAITAFLWRIVDTRVIDGVVNGTAILVGGLANLIRQIETGYVRNYALAIFTGAVVLVGYLLYNR